MFPPKDFNKEKVLDDIARLAGGAASVAGGLGKQVKEEARSRIDDIASRMDLVPREDFERLEEMLKEARLQQEALTKRVEALEGKKTKTASKKPATKAKTKATNKTP